MSLLLRLSLNLLNRLVWVVSFLFRRQSPSPNASSGKYRNKPCTPWHTVSHSCHHGLRHGRLVAASPRQWIGGTLDVAVNYFHGNTMDYEMISLHGLQAVSVD
jgi:hypothetical protein